MEELEKVIPIEAERTINGEKILITNFKFGVIIRANKLFRDLQGVIRDAIRVRPPEEGGTTIDALSLLESGGEDILTLMGLAIGKPREWFDTVDPDDGVLLLADIVGVNADFLSRRMLPALKTALGGMGKALPGLH